MNEARDPIREAHAAALRSPIDTIREELQRWVPGLRRGKPLAALAQVEHQLVDWNTLYGQLEMRRRDTEARAVAAEAALSEANARWQEMEHPFDKSEYDAMFERAEAAEQRANDLADALRAADDVIQWIGRERPKTMREVPTDIWQTLRAARAALDRHTQP